MKRWYKILMAVSLALATSGIALTLTADAARMNRELIARALISASVIAMIVCALARPAARAETAGNAFKKIDSANHACTFQNVAANDEARESLLQLSQYLKSPEKYARMGARMPKGVLLYGPPGTGKTLLARALAGEAGVPFFALSGSDFVEKYVGVGAMRVRELFKRARKAGKCVIFIDEIDAMGKARGDNSSDERDQTLNALLSEMSGFQADEGILVVAATNRIEMLDPALTRPGRFDRKIEVGLPGKRERLSILSLHGRGKPLDADVDLDQIAAETAYFSGASLENLFNEAAILAVERGKAAIGMSELRAAVIGATVGKSRESRANEREKRVIAVHEAGHAIAVSLLLGEKALRRVSILPAGHGAAGYNLTLPEERVIYDRTDLEKQMCMLLSGRAAEEIVFGEEKITTGAENDLARAAEIAAAMVTQFALGGEPAVSVQTLARKCGSNANTDGKCREILNAAYARAKNLLMANIESLGALAEALIARETLSGDEVRTILTESCTRLSNETAHSAKEA